MANQMANTDPYWYWNQKLDNGSGSQFKPVEWTTTVTTTFDKAIGNPFSSTNVMSREMKEQEAQQRKIDDGRPDEVKNILRQLGYNVR